MRTEVYNNFPTGAQIVPETLNFGKPKNMDTLILSKEAAYRISSKSDEVEKIECVPTAL